MDRNRPEIRIYPVISLILAHPQTQTGFEGARDGEAKVCGCSEPGQSLTKRRPAKPQNYGLILPIQGKNIEIKGLLADR